MPSPEPPPSSGPTGFVRALRTLGDGLIATIEKRFELLSLEVQEEKLRLIQIFIWISATVFTGMMALTFASLAFVYCFPESRRLFALTGLAVVYSAALLALILAFRRHLARQPRPFAASLQALREDRACIRNPN